MYLEQPDQDLRVSTVEIYLSMVLEKSDRIQESLLIERSTLTEQDRSFLSHL